MSHMHSRRRRRSRRCSWIISCRHQCRHQSWVHHSRQPTRLTQLGAVELSICPVQPKPIRVEHYCPTADGLQLAPRPEEGLDGQVRAGEGDAGVGEGRRDAGRRNAGEGERRIVDRLKGRCRRWRCKRCTRSRRKRRRRRWHWRRRQSHRERHVCQLRRRWYRRGCRCWQWQQHVQEGQGLGQRLSTGGTRCKGKFGVGLAGFGTGLGLGLDLGLGTPLPVDLLRSMTPL